MKISQNRKITNKGRIKMNRILSTTIILVSFCLVIHVASQAWGDDTSIWNDPSPGELSYTGKVGIGTTSPKEDLHVEDTIRIGVDLNYPLVFGELKHKGSGTGFKINANANGGWADMHLQTDGTTKVFIESKGNVGIGTTSPGTKLEINGDGTHWSKGFLSIKNNNNDAGIRIYDSNSTVRHHIFNDNSNNDALRIAPHGGFASGGITIKQNGRVGIGTPNDLLGNLNIKGGTVASISLKSNNTRSALLSGYDSDAAFIITRSPTSLSDEWWMSITSDGRVGIGTTIFDHRLNVWGNAVKSQGGGSWATWSDIRLKKIQGEFNAGLKEIMMLSPIRYRYRKDNSLGLPDQGDHIGLSAQAVQKVIPEAVSKNNKDYLMLNNDPVIWAMLNAIKEQQRKIEELETRLNERLAERVNENEAHASIN